jgi:hypothetical protein
VSAVEPDTEVAGPTYVPPDALAKTR